MTKFINYYENIKYNDIDIFMNLKIIKIKQNKGKKKSYNDNH